MLTLKKNISKALNITSIILVVMFLNSCGTTHKIKRNFKRADKENSFFKGFVLYNPTTKKELINYNGFKYFTPASNTKLFTFYTAYKTLEDSIIGLEYYKTKDSILIKGTADPSLLYGLETSKIIDFLKKQTDSIYLIDDTINENSFGSGWAWDDYQYYYMPEKSLFPMYGNLVKHAVNDSLQKSVPSYFKQNTLVLDTVSTTREFTKNIFYIQKNSEKINTVPFITSNQLVAKLLSEEIQKKIKLISTSKKYNFKTLKSVTSDELYKKMLIESDNFIAEQLLLQVGKKVSDSYSVKLAINYALTNYLEDLPQKPRWVDGSGLSRYNLFSPNDFVFLLEKMFHEITLQKLLNYFPVSNETNTINLKPFVHAKSGSLSNNYNLSGYLITKKGTVLIFSYMNNHYQIPTSKIKNTIHETLKLIYNNY
ncbi:MAG: D-alanyl-D-alanine carboxypeptidase [Lutibacter sp.]|uniref:D-alanyl-D-alanine carboxypeptidase n=1 Tax=Lutibacter sp. TaxID=1925666 RepID=UPI0019D9047D|nr:D-alanyl-D-alanine carboxypeptidase [Lutibacter sp.]NOR29089.1 D-alanyl-D-alanine carboxypeptidase [Lutibacter sp.]